MGKKSAKLDILGEILLNWRINKVIPYIKGYLLDIGCGTNKLVRKHGNGLGIDVFQFGDADMILEDTSQTPFEDKTFDTISIIASLNHIPNREQVIEEVQRILKDNGRLIITMIPDTISKIWHKIREPWDKDQTERSMKEGEVYGMSTLDIKNILDNNNFEIKTIKKFMFRINNIFIAKKKI
jgi:ubiquinone/menaquinone biosynthesis C-methylase UbiE